MLINGSLQANFARSADLNLKARKIWKYVSGHARTVVRCMTVT